MSSQLQYTNPVMIRELMEMLSYARPHSSRVEAAFVDRFINPLPGIGYDKFGNGFVRIGNAPVLYSCHTDTVHHKDGMQQVQLKQGIASLVSGTRGDCLGADDGAGVWLMLQMVREHIPGLYVFHAGEEHGGLGSRFIRDSRADLLNGIKYAIAFDRNGTQDVITHQGERTCSDAFAYSLAAFLGMGYKPDPTGTFTDTAHYTDHIGECSNVSVGYEGAHGHGETLDVAHLMLLRDRMLQFDCAYLVAERQPGEKDPEDERTYEHLWSTGKTTDPVYDESLLEMCEQYPDAAAKLIANLGGNANDMLQAIIDEGYNVGLEEDEEEED